MNVMKIIIYASQYGSTKQYADELSKRTGIETVEYTEITDINQYDTIVYLGPLYAGSVMGLKKTLNKIRNVQDKKLIVGTVGLADPNDKRNREEIMNGIKQQVHGCIYNKARVYFLRGALLQNTLKRHCREFFSIIKSYGKLAILQLV